MADGTDKTFHLGLTMAGAISAGAYTAGVLDKLLEALDLHNARFERGKAAGWTGETAGFPKHRVVLRVISGTSAGGVSAGLAVAGLMKARKREDSADGTQIGIGGSGKTETGDGYAYDYSYILKPLHQVWVEDLDLFRKTGSKREGFLTNDDLAEKIVTENGRKVEIVRSALNSKHIDDAANASLTGIDWCGKPYRFVAEDLEIFLTTTNLQGIPYQLRFGGDEGETSAHTMSQHSVVRHFRVTGLGTERHVSDWLSAWGDAGIPLRPASGPIDFDGEEWHPFKVAAIATGAFPVGLAARVLDAQARDFGPLAPNEPIRGGALPIDLRPMGGGSDIRPVPQLAPLKVGTESVTYVAVDGGVANNEPFELARYTLRKGRPGAEALAESYLEPNPREAHEADRAVLMIDPFPEGPVFTALKGEQAQKLSGIGPVVRTLVPALINQARFKPGELIQATSQAVHSRYLLAPSRRETEDELADRALGGTPAPVRLELTGAEAIACGSFGGFGGFFDRGFRAHDYMLGQRNCHSFLVKHFRLDTGNPVLGGDGRPTGDMVPVVDPGQSYIGAWPPLPAWPRISQRRLDPILTEARTRVAEVGSRLVRLSEMPFLLRTALGTIWSINIAGVEGVGSRIGMALKSIALSELIERDQHHDFIDKGDGVPFADWERAVLVALAKAGDVPLPVALPEGAPEKARERTPRDLLSVRARFEPEADPAADPAVRSRMVAELDGFLRERAVRPHLWKAPERPDTGPAYTMATLAPASKWVVHAAALGARVKGLFGF